MLFDNMAMNDFQHPTHIKLDGNMKEFSNIIQRRDRWSPYESNEGTIAAVCHKDCVVIAGDTRISRGYSILHRNWSKMHKLSDIAYLFTTGMCADITALRKQLDENIKLYEYKMGQKPSFEATGRLLCKRDS